MTPQKYVGYVSKAINAFDWKADYHTYAIQLTSPTIPAACEGDGISADMYTPVFPSPAHPQGRAPLRSRRALPWSGCQQPSFMRSIFFSNRRMQSGHRRILAEEDAQRSVLLQSTSQSSAAAKPGARGSYVEFSDLDEYAGDFSCPVDFSDGAHELEDEEQYYAEAVQASRPPDTMVVVDVSYDLSQLTELPDPLQFFEEKRQLKELVAESKARTSGIIECSTSGPPPEVNITKEGLVVDQPVKKESQSQVYPDLLSPTWEYRQLVEPFLDGSHSHLVYTRIREDEPTAGILFGVYSGGWVQFGTRLDGECPPHLVICITITLL
ncbi:hypothetical protein MVEN_00315800 [Mycena venus]|uniref:Uncharacterized protein n=1 Tax=Mycena venus TaxID=2733690 RepID=A0A8H6Z3H7_9AGAR|nr:hypothetical protein MVEN_00315800 [Mycena venus]